MHTSSMRRVMRVAFGIALAVSAAAPARAESFDVGIFADAIVPQGAFADNIEENGYGVSVQGFYQPGELPFKIGLEIGYSLYGSAHRNEPFSLTIPDVTVRVVRYNQILRANLVCRLQRWYGRVAPYLDCSFGLNHLWTTTSAQSSDLHIGFASSTTLEDTAPVYGIGGGVMVKLYHAEEKNVTLSLDTGIRYQAGGEADYLSEGADVLTGGGTVSYRTHTSETNFLNGRLGIVVSF